MVLALAALLVGAVILFLLDTRRLHAAASVTASMPVNSRVHVATGPPLPREGAVSADASPAAAAPAGDGLLQLGDARENRRLEAILALEQRGDDTAARALAYGLRDPSVRVRRIALEALAGVTGPAADESLLLALQDPDAGIRAAAVDVLGERGGDVLPGLSQALHDIDSGVRLAAVEALGEMPGSEAASILQLALADPHVPVREAAADLLAD